ncbi:hypothetical protein [Mediterraneibacter glycyrrhizinilyticus]|nr:hypothetical protein [Mediterraneibacter glycyrrhizinilyticus]
MICIGRDARSEKERSEIELARQERGGTPAARYSKQFYKEVST